MPVALAVALGGALGALARYGLDRLIERRTESVFPWSTFAINASGCLVIGVVIAALVDRHHTPAWLRVGLVMGVVGGYTTFSTYGAGDARPVRGEPRRARAHICRRQRRARGRRGVRGTRDRPPLLIEV